MSMTSKIGALFFKHHQSESKKAKKKKRPLVLAMPPTRLARLQNGPAISQHMSLETPASPRPPLAQRFEAIPDDLPTVTAPPPGTAALEEADTADTSWGGGDTVGAASTHWCRSYCCSPCE